MVPRNKIPHLSFFPFTSSENCRNILSDITGNIMDAGKLEKIRREINAARRKAVTARDLLRIASALGRSEFTGRGKEPTFVSKPFPLARPISIPKHGNKNLKPGTKKNILNDLENDWLRHKEQLDKKRESDITESNEYEN
jgi:hypothetical protein